MQLNLEKPDYEYFLRAASGRSALVNTREINASFIVSPQHLIEDWPVADVGQLTVELLQPLLALQPEVVLLGTGERQRFPGAQIIGTCLSRGVGIEIMTNAAAARTYHVLAGENRRVVAGFILQPR